LATLPTFDESGVAVRRTGDQEPHRGIRISDASAGGLQPVGVAPSAPVAAPCLLDKGKGAAGSSSAPGGTGGGGRRKRGDAGCTTLTGHSLRTLPRSVRGPLVEPRRPAPRPRARRGASVLRHHHHRVRRHHNHHNCRVRHRHHHLGVISPMDTSSNNNNSSSSIKSSGRPAR
jgi:hypothetical protein